MNNELIEKIKEIVKENYSSKACGYTSDRSQGNSDDVFSDGDDFGSSWLAYEIGCLLDMDLPKPEEPEEVW